MCTVNRAREIFSDAVILYNSTAVAYRMQTSCKPGILVIIVQNR